MFSNLTLYYLNQLEIVPWINKEHSLKFQDSAEQVNRNPFKLVILVSADLSHKAQVLLNHMMAYINLKNDELLIIKILAKDSVENKNRPWYSQVENSTPRAMLVLGLNDNELFIDLNLTFPVVRSLSVEDLLNNPQFKKKVFNDLNILKSLVS
ncbi:hypothetical protein TUM19329_17350 [Legionella antarctica]|uniref:DNA polymerase III subunit psi n=1 Tax=Legionella antarctica TaxID=2708020 RepID=A0A6F8T3W3_9GAMM|nr:hypothetical protein [Legionella antarctica]BCA95374.1 hypothetical protein TUM19329_17350 [Legionella antarctica]